MIMWVGGAGEEIGSWAGKRCTKQPPIISPLFSLSMDFSILVLAVVVALHLVRALPFPNYTHSYTFSPRSNRLYIFRVMCRRWLPFSNCVCVCASCIWKLRDRPIWNVCNVPAMCVRCVFWCPAAAAPIKYSCSATTGLEYTSRTFYLARLFYC